MALEPCIVAFIKAILCGNPILRGSFTTLLNSIILQLDEEIALTTLQLNRLNILNQVLSFEITAVNAVVSKTQADLNLFLGPFQQYPNCPTLANLNNEIQNNAVSKAFSGLQRKISELNRVTNLVQYLNTLTTQREQLRSSLQNIVNSIGGVCNP